MAEAQSAGKDLIIALDEGTSNAKAVAIDAQGRVIAQSSRPLQVQTPQAGWVEQRGEVLIDATLTVLREVIENVGVGRIAALAISNQRETAMGWVRADGEPIGPAITWQCSRSAAFCEQLRRDHQESIIRDVTGLPIAPLFSGSKMRWLLDSIPNGFARAAAGEVCLGTVDAWLLWHLTAGSAFRCDTSNAARTQLLNLHSGDWDDEMLRLFGIPRQALPEICPSSGWFGETKGVAGVPDGLPILAMIGDSHAALYGHGLGEAGAVKATYGTGSSVMAPIPQPESSIVQLATTVAWHDGQRLIYGLEGNIPHTGDAVAWMAQITGLTDGKGETLARALTELPASVESTLGVYFVPALTGAGAPWWDDKARGVISGLSRGVDRAHLIRAALESIAYQIADVIDAMRQHPDFHLSSLMVDGGPTRNPWLMQFQADLLGCKVLRSNTPELSALGAGLLARKALDNLDHSQLWALLPQHDVFSPDTERHLALQQQWLGWKAAVASTLSQSKTID
ncbi:FGGY family carbohydrate kinase [Serratia sp. M24T3]|uniref:FGGY family carbohydrate kinase n=1 Tax=Serratia sp. M24T3 TaxID=932213 RepID=UPI00025B8E51|nr:FGGY-family carbohydrate kinase [Serratia sp. M24T3]EIC85169.1 glycerol kinase [Serratia sp. M24T3]